MREAKFKIGDRVKSVSHGTGEVKEALYSSLNDCWYYEVMECNTTLVCTLSEGDLEMAPEKKEYKMTAVIAPSMFSSGDTTDASRCFAPKRPKNIATT